MEVYRNILGKYEVSNLGNVRNSKTGKILKPFRDRYGYCVVCLHEQGKNYFKKIHRLVAEAFIDNEYNKPCIDHIDGNRENNVYSNLRWVTPKENTHNPITLEKIKANCKAPETPTKPVLCKETNTVYVSAVEAEQHTSADASSIGKCCRGERYTAGGCHWEYAT